MKQEKIVICKECRGEGAVLYFVSDDKANTAAVNLDSNFEYKKCDVCAGCGRLKRKVIYEQL